MAGKGFQGALEKSDDRSLDGEGLPLLQGKGFQGAVEKLCDGSLDGAGGVFLHPHCDGVELLLHPQPLHSWTSTASDICS